MIKGGPKGAEMLRQGAGVGFTGQLELIRNPEPFCTHLDLRQRFFARDVERTVTLRQHLVRELQE